MRKFLAIPLPEHLRRAAAASCSVLLVSGEGWRLARPEGLHVTIRFLGEVEPSRDEELNAAWREAARGARQLSLRLAGATLLPAAHRPRVLCLRVKDDSEDGTLLLLADRVERAAREHGFRPEPRAIAAHVTLARARSRARVVSPEVARVGDIGSFIAERLVLYRSVAERGGSRYIEEASFPLTTEGA
jgi:2'-5' RNA ligase